jgi:hypothetical protein
MISILNSLEIFQIYGFNQEKIAYIQFKMEFKKIIILKNAKIQFLKLINTK